MNEVSTTTRADAARLEHIAQSVLIEHAFPNLTLPAIEQAAAESGCDPWDLVGELVCAANRVRRWQADELLRVADSLGVDAEAVFRAVADGGGAPGGRRE